MAPPIVPGVPGMQLPPQKPPETRPPISNPPPPRVQMASVSEGQIVLRRGRWNVSLPSAFAFALCTSVGGGIITWLNRPPSAGPAATAALQTALDTAVTELKAHDAAADKRIGDLESKLGLADIAMANLNNRITDRLVGYPPPRVDPLAPGVSDALRK